MDGPEIIGGMERHVSLPGQGLTLLEWKYLEASDLTAAQAKYRQWASSLADKLEARAQAANKVRSRRTG